MPSAIIAIGDELLAGFTLDTNSHWLAERLRLLGHPLKRITTIKDRREHIVEQIRRDLADPDVEVLLCMGGLGPTPDDRTFEAVAAALERPLRIEPEVLARIERRVRRLHEAGLVDSAQVSEGNRRMADIPAAPARVLRNRRGMAPALMYEAGGTRLFVLPGVPAELKAIFTEEIEPEHLAGRSAATVRELRFAFAVEARFYPVMRELEESHPDVSVGSYPHQESRELVIRCLGDDVVRVDQAIALIRQRVAAMGLTPVP